jgi:hypothetical protein
MNGVQGHFGTTNLWMINYSWMNDVLHGKLLVRMAHGTIGCSFPYSSCGPIPEGVYTLNRHGTLINIIYIINSSLHLR